jgi:nucleoside-diphosphate-sugar epimerase
VAVLGATGFVGSHVCSHLRQRNVEVISISRKQVDLEKRVAARKLRELIPSKSHLIVCAAIAPAKSLSDYEGNIAIQIAINDLLASHDLSHITYVSSDAVYADSSTPIVESSTIEPQGIHGAMHYARETMLRSLFGEKLLILRPTLIFGPGDPHGGYGPNSFVREARETQSVTLFGEGEEVRDHIFVEDVAEVISSLALESKTGVINVVTGRAISFRDIANLVIENSTGKIALRKKLRSGPMPHGGYRVFNNERLQSLLPNFVPSDMNQAIAAWFIAEQENRAGAH